MTQKYEGLPVPGYVAQAQANVTKVNSNKFEEEAILRRFDEMKEDPTIDQRWLAIARSHFEQGYMALNRSIFRPTRVRLPEDDE